MHHTKAGRFGRGRKRGASAGLFFGALFILTGSPPGALAAADAHNTNNGVVKIHDGSTEPDRPKANDPHVCRFHLEASGFDAGQDLKFEVSSWSPGDRAPALEGVLTSDATGAARAPEGGEYALPEGHYRLRVDTGDGRPTSDKHKTFWVDCPVEGPAPVPVPLPEAPIAT